MALAAALLPAHYLLSDVCTPSRAYETTQRTITSDAVWREENREEERQREAEQGPNEHIQHYRPFRRAHSLCVCSRADVN